ncbi:unnamed protein product [Chondrus crispus]|uniref:Uncharacterized protein n=1 Tax=Chondrus crispus TaxID=2769 RepID=R7QGK9_CHOCR|nr:unnamed protein product [Chondrus crispus]CDF36535.1 unnamed protein product [Chondrus crispus]|eukprot:XP_005716354.1 unnamed protein product [Chondrus crispus]
MSGLKSDDAKGPEVNQLSVLAAAEHLWGDVLARAAKGLGHVDGVCQGDAEVGRGRRLGLLGRVLPLAQQLDEAQVGSAMRTWPSRSSRTFSSFKSRYTTNSLWM